MDHLAGIISNRFFPDFKLVENLICEPWNDLPFKTDIKINDSFGIGKRCCVENLNAVDAFIEKNNRCIIAVLGEIFNLKDVALQLNLEAPARNEPSARVISRFYFVHGTNFVPYLDGEFVVCIYDSKSETLLLINDRNGLRPFYYAHENESLVFGSKLGSLINNGIASQDIDIKAVLELLAFEHLIGNRTLLKQFKLLPAGTIAKFENRMLTFEKYYEYTFRSTDELTHMEDAVDVFSENLKSAVARRLPTTGLLGLPLSGGKDSRAFAAVACELEQPTVTATFGEEGCYDRIAAKEISSICRFKHLDIPIKKNNIIDFMRKGVQITDGMTNAVHYHIFQLLEEIKSYTGLCFDGATPWGSGIVGPMVFKVSRFSDKVQGYLLSLNSGFPIKKMDQWWNHSSIDGYLEATMGGLFESIKYLSPFNQAHFIYLTQRCRRFTVQGDLILRTKVVNRRPFYDNGFTEFILALPEGFRKNTNLFTFFYKKFYPEVSKVLYTSSGMPLNRLPKFKQIRHVCNRIKCFVENRTRLNFVNRKRTVNYRPVFAKLLRKSPQLLIPEPNNGIYDFIKKDYLSNIISEHMTGKKDHTKRIGLIFTLSNWLGTK